MTKKNSMFAALVAIAVTAFVGGVNAEEAIIAGGMNAGEGDSKAGKTKSELCQGCHGADGISIDPATYPNLAGQYAGYIFKQVQDFQLGNRQDDTMSAMAGMVTSRQDLKDIAAYFASRKQMKGKPSGSKAAKSGARLYKSGNKKLGEYGACVRCHGKNGKGKGKSNSLFPVIGGQQKAYIIKQLKDFKSGKRTNDPAGMMAMVAKGLSDKEITAVADYVSGL
ncbi:MAG TPA: c-type cytochrome [Gammaproteobacteria bacterium]|nr:c-type cytochrome [Gammaproteobacteria bacterium]